MTPSMDDLFRTTISRELAQRDIIEFLLAAFLDSRPAEARDALVAYLQKEKAVTDRHFLSIDAAELWEDVAVRRLEERIAIVKRAQELQAKLDGAYQRVTERFELKTDLALTTTSSD